MAEKRSPWLWGCGISCGALIILAIVVTAGSFLFFRNTFSPDYARTVGRS